VAAQLSRYSLGGGVPAARRSKVKKNRLRGVSIPAARQLLLDLPNVVEGRSYGMPSFLLNGRFLARFRDEDTVLVLQLATISERDVLMALDPAPFFFTEHYRNYPAVLVRLAEVAAPLLTDVVTESWRHVSALPPGRPRKAPKRRGKGSERKARVRRRLTSA
jgi:hypothetical protein